MKNKNFFSILAFAALSMALVDNSNSFGRKVNTVNMKNFTFNKVPTVQSVGAGTVSTVQQTGTSGITGTVQQTGTSGTGTGGTGTTSTVQQTGTSGITGTVQQTGTSGTGTGGTGTTSTVQSGLIKNLSFSALTPSVQTATQNTPSSVVDNKTIDELKKELDAVKASDAALLKKHQALQKSHADLQKSYEDLQALCEDLQTSSQRWASVGLYQTYCVVLKDQMNAIISYVNGEILDEFIDDLQGAIKLFPTEPKTHANWSNQFNDKESFAFLRSIFDLDTLTHSSTFKEIADFIEGRLNDVDGVNRKKYFGYVKASIYNHHIAPKFSGFPTPDIDELNFGNVFDGASHEIVAFLDSLTKLPSRVLGKANEDVCFSFEMILYGPFTMGSGKSFSYFHYSDMSGVEKAVKSLTKVAGIFHDIRVDGTLGSLVYKMIDAYFGGRDAKKIAEGLFDEIKAECEKRKSLLKDATDVDSLASTFYAYIKSRAESMLVPMYTNEFPSGVKDWLFVDPTKTAKK